MKYDVPTMIKSISRFLALAPVFLIPLFALFPLPLPLTPFTLANDLFFPFISGKGFYFRVLVELAFLSWVVLAFIDAKYRPQWKNPLTIAVTAFAVITLAADLLGVNPLRSLWSNFERMEGWITIVHLWMLFMVMVYGFGIGDMGKRLWRAWLNTSIGVAVVVAIYGLFQLLRWSPIHQGSTRIDASLGNAEYMAVYMLISAGFAAYMLYSSKARRARAIARESTDTGFRLAGDIVHAFDLTIMEWVYAALAVLFSYELYETATRGTTLGLLGAVMLSLFVYAIFGRRESSGSRTIAATFLILIIAAGGLFWLNRDAAWIQKSEPLSRLANISWSETQTQARAYIWPMAIKGAAERPVLGWGQENFNYLFNSDYNPKMYSQEQWFDRAHSVYLDWLVAAGGVGLVAYLALYVLFLLAVWRSSLTMAEKSVLTGLLAGYAVHNVFVFDNLASYIGFFALLAFAASLKPAIEAGEGSSALITPAREVSMELVEYVVAPVAIVVLIFSVYFFTVRPMQENIRLIAAVQACGGSAGILPDASLFDKALSAGAYLGKQEIREQLLSCSGSVISAQSIPNPTKQAFFELASNEVKAQLAATPNDARIYVLAGAFFDQIGAFDQGVPLLETAHRLSPAKQTIDFELSTAYINTGKYDEAVALLKTAYESATDNATAQTAYATALVIDGKEADAKKLFGANPAIFNTEQMAQAYTAAKQYPSALAIYKNIMGTSTDNIAIQLKIAQTQYAAKMVWQSIQTLELIKKNHPEYATQIDAAIKQVEAGK